jgi:hypothetical protein
VTDDIFDYFSGNSNRKVEPIDDEDDEQAESNDTLPSDVRGDDDSMERDNDLDASRTESARNEEPEPVADEANERISHWDRLLGKLGIAPAAKKTTAPKSVERPARSAEEKAARAIKRKQQEKHRAENVQPFGGIAAPAGARPHTQREVSSTGKTTSAETSSKASQELKKSHSTKRDKPAAAPSKFGMGILDEISSTEPTPAVPHGSETLADLFAASEKFEPPFEEPRREIDDLAPYTIDDVEPFSERVDDEPSGSSEPVSDFVEEVAEFIEYEVQDLDFSDAEKEPPRRPSRRDRARRNRGKQDSGPQPESGRGRRDQAADEVSSQPPARRGRNSRNQDQTDLDFEREDSPIEEDKATPTRGRRRSRGRGRGRGSRDARTTRDVVDHVEIDDIEFTESMEIDEREDFGDHEPKRDRGRGRDARGGSRRTRDDDRVRDDVEIEGDPYGVYDDVEPESSRDRGRRRQSGDEDTELEDGKRTQIPTWSEAVGSMVELNIKSRGSRPSGSGRGRGSRRPRRR